MGKNRKLLYEVFRQSKHANFQKFLNDITDDNGIINSEILFQYKKDHDKMIKEALNRVNDIGKPIEKDVDKEK